MCSSWESWLYHKVSHVSEFVSCFLETLLAEHWAIVGKHSANIGQPVLSNVI